MTKTGKEVLEEPLTALSLGTAAGVLILSHPLLALFLLATATFLAHRMNENNVLYALFALFLTTSLLTALGLYRNAKNPLQKLSDPTPAQAFATILTPSQNRGQLFSQQADAQVKIPGRRKPLSTRLILLSPTRLALGQSYFLQGNLEKPLSFENPGVFSYRRYLAQQGITRIFFVAQAQPQEGFASLPAQLGKLSLSYSHKLQQNLGEEEGSLLASLLFGHRFLGLPRELKEALKKTGAMHLVAASGFHLGLLLLFLGTLGLLRFGLFSFFSALLLLFAYAAMTGFPLSMQRALAMGLLFLYAFIFRRPYQVFSALCAAFIVLLWLSPQAIFQIDFQLSFASTLAILLAIPLLPKREGMAGWALSLFLVSTAAFLFTAPILSTSFHRLPLLAPLFQLLFLPLATALFFLGMASLLPPLFFLLKPLLFWLTHAFVFFAKQLSLLPFASHLVATPAPLFTFFYYGSLLSFLFLEKKRTSLFLAAAALFTNSFFLLLPTPPQLAVLDVGQGDSSLFTQGGFSLLVDGGGPTGGRPFSSYVGEQVVLPYLLHRGIRALDVVVATHADSDHIDGLFPILENLPVHLLLYGGKEGEPTLQKLLALARSRSIRTLRAEAGTLLRIGKKTTILVLHPSPQSQFFSSNNQSAVLQITTPRGRILLTGDIEGEAETMLLPKLEPVTLLKVAHHGSKTSTTEAFLEKTAPRIAIVSVGAHNPFGHPNAQVLKRLRDEGASVYLTKDKGCLSVTLKEMPQVQKCS